MGLDDDDDVCDVDVTSASGVGAIVASLAVKISSATASAIAVAEDVVVAVFAAVAVMDADAPSLALDLRPSRGAMADADTKADGSFGYNDDMDRRRATMAGILDDDRCRRPALLRVIGLIIIHWFIGMLEVGWSLELEMICTMYYHVP